MRKICNPFKTVRKKSNKNSSKSKLFLFKAVLQDDKGRKKNVTVFANNLNTAIDKILRFYSCPLRVIKQIKIVK